MLSIIAAIGQNGELGKGGRMPWHIPEDLKRFRRITEGHAVIMGRATFESLPGVLAGRVNVVATKDRNWPAKDGVTVTYNVTETLKSYATLPGEAFVIGGGEIYRIAMPMCERLYITHIFDTFEADVFFPPIPGGEFVKTRESEALTDPRSGLNYLFSDYERIAT